MKISYFAIGTSGQIIQDKISGKIAEVTEVTSDKIIAAETRNGQIVENGEIFEITEDNAICFRFIKDPNPKDVPQSYGFDEDNLVAPDGEKIPLGSIVVQKILGYIRGFVVLLCGYEYEIPSVRLYNVLKNKFQGYEELLSSNVRVISSNDETIVLISDDQESVFQPADGDQEEKETFRFSKSRVTTIYKSYINSVDVPYILRDKALMLDETGQKMILESGLYFENEDIILRHKPISIEVDVLDGDFDDIPGTYTEGKFTERHSMLIGPDGIYLDGKTIKVDTTGLSGYLNLVDVTVEPDGKIIRSLATDDRKVKKLITVKTEDRGAITTVA